MMQASYNQQRMSHENRLLMEEQEDNHVSKEEVFNEDFNDAPNGAVHRLSRVLIGLCPAGEQAVILGHGGHSNCVIGRIINRF